MSGYQRLFAIKVNHHYFADKVCPHLQFMPTQSSANLMQKAGLLHNPQQGGIGVFADQNNIEVLKLYAKDQDEPLALTFKVYCTDSLFINYTTPQILKPGKILYFLGQMDGQSAQLSLHKDPLVSESDFFDVPTLIKQDIIDSSAELQNCCFVVTLVLNENAIAAFAANQDTKFTLDFEAKSTIWQYYLMGNHIDSQTRIVDLDDTINFEACDSEILATGKQAYIFRTQSALGLQEKSPYRFQLRSAQGNGSKVLIKRLPVASPGQQYQAVIDGNRAALSEIYINY